MTKLNRANSPYTTAEELHILATNECNATRICVSKNINTAKETLIILSKDPCALVRYTLVSNHNVPPEALENLAKDIGAAIRHKAARHPNATEFVRRIVKLKDHLNDT